MTDDDRGLPERAADVAFFAPLGLVLEARRLVPDLAERGRRQVEFTRVVGRYAVTRGRGHLDAWAADGMARVAGWLDLDGARAGGEGETPPPPRLASVPEDAPGPDPGALAIPDYDSLSAFQVVPRLDGLDHAELEDVRSYELATRGRRTILNKIAQLSSA